MVLALLFLCPSPGAWEIKSHDSSANRDNETVHLSEHTQIVSIFITPLQTK